MMDGYKCISSFSTFGSFIGDDENVGAAGTDKDEGGELREGKIKQKT